MRQGPAQRKRYAGNILAGLRDQLIAAVGALDALERFMKQHGIASPARSRIGSDQWADRSGHASSPSATMT